MGVSANFVIQEFVYPELYKQYGDKSIWFIDDRIVTVAQYLRDWLDRPVTINNWHTGGQYKESGLRSFTTKTGAKNSQHKFGRAADLKVSGMDRMEVLEFIQKKEAVLMALGLTTVENPNFTRTWLHIDCRFTGKDKLFMVNP